ncbi:MAG: zinc ribbon domain-containing protein [Burkholderiaceae bacterium]|nr:zinc ribbon domain-containing protein [Burkholderiaceae bacterium]
MFCSRCGVVATDEARFCSKCGTSLDEDLDPLARSTHQPAIAMEADPLSFGNPSNRWWVPFMGKNSFPSGYEWLEQRNTLLVCPNHLVLLQGDEKRSGALDIIQSMGLVGSAVGVIRNLKDAVANKKFELSGALATRLFEEKLMVWCRKSDAVIWRYHEKPWMFIKSSSEQLYCQFNSKAGVLHACCILWCTAEDTGHGKGDIEGFGCRIVDAGSNLPEKKVPEAMAASRAGIPD